MPDSTHRKRHSLTKKLLRALRGVRDAVHSQTRAIIYALHNTIAIATEILLACWNCSFLVREKISDFVQTSARKSVSFNR
jgi:hypothetical protein